jgi:glyoxylase-like metal-dependent hydrolase (beta-lactamase superfamily II)
MKLSRRRFIARGAAAASCLPLAPLTASVVEASAPAAGKQVPAVFRSRLGAFELTAIGDGYWPRTVDADFVRNADLMEVQTALRMAFLPIDVLHIPITALVVNTGGKLVLIDTGAGGRMAPTTGMLTENLEAAGFDPRAVDAVVISHFHPDHILGLRNRDGAPAFPNAEVSVPAREWAFWMDDGEMSRAPDGQRWAFQAARKVFGSLRDVRRFEDKAEIVAGITAVAAFGHSPGHMAFRIASGTDQLLSLSDAAYHPALFVRHPNWQIASDMDGPMAAATRARLLDMAAGERIRIAASHFPFPAIGHIARARERYRYVPLDRERAM